MTHLGFFEGFGGFALAAEWMGWETVAWCEINPFCQRILRYYFPNAKPHGDIKETCFKKYANTIKVVTGGFPCQPYSTAGKRLGKNDERHLWPQMLRGIREVQSPWVVGENVRGLVNWSGGMVFNEVQTDLEAEGYEVFPFLLPAAGVNAPHERYRIWFIAYSFKNELAYRGPGEIGQAEAESKSKKDKWERVWKELTGIGAKEFIANANTQRFSEWQSIRENDDAKLQAIKRGGSIKHNVAHDLSLGRLQRNQEPEASISSQSIPDWGNFPTQSPVCGGNDGLPSELDGITFSNWRRKSIEGFGNAVVPQLPYKIYKAIEQYEFSPKPFTPKPQTN